MLERYQPAGALSGNWQNDLVVVPGLGEQLGQSAAERRHAPFVDTAGGALLSTVNTHSLLLGGH